MRYLLLQHAREAELRQRPAEWIEEVMAFLVQFEDELLSSSELEWTETLAWEGTAELVGPDEEVRSGWINEQGIPLRRIWSIRVDSLDRARELAGVLADELDTWIELRECLTGSQRP